MSDFMFDRKHACLMCNFLNYRFQRTENMDYKGLKLLKYLEWDEKLSINQYYLNPWLFASKRLHIAAISQCKVSLELCVTRYGCTL